MTIYNFKYIIFYGFELKQVLKCWPFKLFSRNFPITISIQMKEKKTLKVMYKYIVYKIKHEKKAINDKVVLERD